MTEETKTTETLLPTPSPQELLLKSIDELIIHNNRLNHRLQHAYQYIITGAFKYSTPETRKNLLDMLTNYADTADDSAKAIVKGMRQIKRVKLRDDDIISKLVHSYAINEMAAPIDQIDQIQTH